MSDIIRKSLPPIGVKPVTMSGPDAQEYTKELVRLALFGPATYHPDGRRISDKHRLERLQQASKMVEKLAERVTSVEGGAVLQRMRRHDIPALSDRIKNRVEAIESGKYRNFPRLPVPGMEADRAMEIPEWDGPPRRFQGI